MNNQDIGIISDDLTLLNFFLVLSTHVVIRVFSENGEMPGIK
jgi:hypothetical protein